MNAQTENILRLPETATLETVPTMTDELRAAIANGPIVVDPRQVTELDFAAVQLLISAARTAAEAGKSLSVTAPEGEMFAEFIHQNGLGSVVARDGEQLNFLIGEK